jgi:hypothetical protein
MIETLQIVIILAIIIIFGSIITYLNIKKTTKTPVSEEQSSWKKIEDYNTRKKQLLKEKEDVSFKYSAKSIDDEEYRKSLNYINEEIKKIEENINKEVNKLSTIQNKEDKESNLRFKNIKLKGKLNEVKLENENLNSRVEELSEYIKSFKNSGNSQNIREGKNINESSKEKYYRIILEKYKDEINNKERKTISEIKSMVKPSDLTIKSIVSKNKPIGYDYNKDYLNTLRKIYNYLKSEISVIKNDLKLLFWLDFPQIIKYQIADEQDISTLLCSIMKALDDENAYIYVVLLEEEKTHAFIKTKYKNKHYIFDLTQKVPFDTFKEDDENKLFENYNFNNKKIIRKIYKYNNRDYYNFEEEL